MHTCNYFPELPYLIHKCRLFPTEIGSCIDQKLDLSLWAANMPCRCPCRQQCPPQPRPLSGLVQSGTKKEASCKEFSDTLGNNSAVFAAKLTKLGGDVSYAVVILLANFQLLPQMTSCPKTLAFKTRHGPRGLQAACKHRKRHVTCNNIAPLHAHLQLFSRTAKYNPQMSIVSVRIWVPHRSNIRFSTLGGKHALKMPMSATVPPHSPAPSPA